MFSGILLFRANREREKKTQRHIKWRGELPFLHYIYIYDIMIRHLVFVVREKGNRNQVLGNESCYLNVVNREGKEVKSWRWSEHVSINTLWRCPQSSLWAQTQAFWVQDNICSCPMTLLSLQPSNFLGQVQKFLDIFIKIKWYKLIVCLKVTKKGDEVLNS